MRITQLAAITLLAAAFGAHNASALTIANSLFTTLIDSVNGTYS